MSEHFIKEIEIKNYKLFKDFKASGFGRVNLIGGKNNVGKTAFMEAIAINLFSKNIESMTHALISVKFAREYLEIGFRQISREEEKIFLESVFSYKSKSNIREVEFGILDSEGVKEYIFKIDGKTNKININDFSYERKSSNSIEFITNYGFTKYKLKRVFENVQKQDAENSLYNFINNFDKDILNFKIIGGDKPQCKTLDGNYRDINEFGDGLKHFISIVCSLYACSNGYLFIDEIDNGIHFSKLDLLWEIILTLSKEQSVQVFATTHSKECIESYARVSKKLDDKEIGFIELGKNKYNKIRAIVMDTERFYDELEVENEVRGW